MTCILPGTYENCNRYVKIYAKRKITIGTQCSSCCRKAPSIDAKISGQKFEKKQYIYIVSKHLLQYTH